MKVMMDNEEYSRQSDQLRSLYQRRERLRICELCRATICATGQSASSDYTLARRGGP